MQFPKHDYHVTVTLLPPSLPTECHRMYCVMLCVIDVSYFLVLYKTIKSPPTKTDACVISMSVTCQFCCLLSGGRILSLVSGIQAFEGLLLRVAHYLIHFNKCHYLTKMTN